MVDILAPTNWDPALVDAYTDLGVVDVYGALRYDPAGGRPSCCRPWGVEPRSGTSGPSGTGA